MQDGTFSDAYWNMHRNTLFFSFVCLLLSAPDVTVGGQISETLALNIGPAAAKFIVSSSLIIALYNLIIFVFEWRQQAWPFLQSKHEIFRSKSDKDAVSLAALVAASEQVLAALSQIKNQITSIFKSWEDAREGVTYGRSLIENQNNSRNHAQMRFNSLVEGFERDERMSRNFIQNRDYEAVFVSLKGGIAAIVKDFDASIDATIGECKRVVESTALQIASSNINPALDRLDSSYKAIEFQEISISVKRRKFSFLRSFGWDSVRVVLFGLALPVALFVTSLAHFTGRFIYQLFDTLIF